MFNIATQFSVKRIRTVSVRITAAYRVVITVGEHVVAEGALAGGDEGVSIDKPAPGGIVIPAL